jgi:hypothetical protein
MLSVLNEKQISRVYSEKHIKTTPPYGITEKWLSYLNGLIRYPVFKRIDSVWNHDGMTRWFEIPAKHMQE